MAIQNITPIYPIVSAKTKIQAPETLSEMAQMLGGFEVGTGGLDFGKLKLQSTAERILIGDASEPLTGIGIFMGKDGGTNYDFRVGDPSNDYMHWDGSAGSLTIVGSLTATSGAIGGWNITSGYIYNLVSGTPTSSPSDGLVLASGNEALIVYENTQTRVEVGYL